MTAKSYALTFDGYWREPNISAMPAKSGIYGVYACTYNAAERTVSIRRLLYIGEAADVQGRVASHETLPAWKRQLQQGEVLCFNAALISPEADRRRAEAAMIFKHKPPCNTEYADNFPFDTTTITTSGKNTLMQPSFTVTRTEKAAAPVGGRRW
jgi:excinuclease UvrABC nuclease subunit